MGYVLLQTTKRGRLTIVNMVMAASLAKDLNTNVGREAQPAIMARIMTGQLIHQRVTVQDKTMNGIISFIRIYLPVMVAV